MSTKVLISHPFGNANVKQTALAFAEANMLAEYWTAISWNEQNWINTILPKSIKNELMRRSYPHSVANLTKHFFWYEIARLIAIRIGATHIASRENGLISSLNCHVKLDARVAKRITLLPDLKAVYAYDHCALNSFKAARQRDIQCIYDLPTGYWRLLRKITLEEIELQPAWQSTAPSINFPPDIYYRKDEELLLANHVVVASKFTQHSLQLLPQMHTPVSVIPYGAPTPVTHHRVNESKKERLRILYVGNLGIMKGLPYLLDAIAQLGSAVTLTLIGSRVGESAALNMALNKHRWIPSLPNCDVLAEMERHDVFVFPSLFDGFGLVILEALSRGLPVITTPNTGGPDLLTEGEDGFIVPIRDSAAIIEKLQLLVDDRTMLAKMSTAALKKATKCSWTTYRKRLVSVVQNLTREEGITS